MPQCLHQSPEMNLYTEYKIDNYVFLVTCYELRNTCSPHASNYGTIRRGHPRQKYVNYTKRLTKMKTNKLVEVSQSCEAWLELVVTSVDP